MATSTPLSSSQSEQNKLRARASHVFEEDIVEPAQEYLARARDFSSRAIDRGSELVRENPGYTILGAAAVGFLLGAYVARRK